MKAIITGITGMVGSHLTDYLLQETNWEIHGICRWRSPLDNIEHLLDRINRRDRVFQHYADINDLSSLIYILRDVRPNYIFHLAAQSYPKTSFESPLETLNTNILGTAHLLEAVRILGLTKTVIHICASSEVFGRVTADKLPIAEDCQFHPASPYAISKIGTDLLGRFYAESYQLTVMTTRMFTHTGPRRGDVFAESSFAKQIAMIESELIPPVIYVGNLDSMRTWADVRDAVRAYYLLVTKKPIAGEFYNIGGNYSCTIASMLEFLISLSTMREIIKVEVEDNRLRPLDADRQIPDTRKFYKHTKWQPTFTFEQTMSDLLNYWRERVNKGHCHLIR